MVRGGGCITEGKRWLDEREDFNVDDQFGIRILLNEVFQKEGYDTFQAANGFQALEIVKNTDPDLVIVGYENSWHGWN